MSNGKRDYKKENKLYNSRPEQIKNRTARNQARAEYEKAHGDQTGKDIDHKKAISKGGSNSKSNLRAVSPSANRSFSRTRTGKMKRND
jgi:5-methylcytosine-specific restriction endonuclease McrA